MVVLDVMVAAADFTRRIFVVAPSDVAVMLMLWAAGASWSAAFGLFAILYGRVLTQPRVTGHDARPI
jgi:uncharacterized protein involved in response to NO